MRQTKVIVIHDKHWLYYKACHEIWLKIKSSGLHPGYDLCSFMRFHTIHEYCRNLRNIYKTHFDETIK
jgi:hypothetical protein